MTDPTVLSNEKLKDHCKDFVSKAKKLVNMKKIESTVNKVVSEIIDETDYSSSSPKSPIVGDVNNLLCKMVEKESVKKLKRDLEGWREVILEINSVLLWEKNWYPGMIAGVTTALFMFLWVMDLSLLTAVSSTGLLVTLLDYLVPTLTASLYSPAHWTGAMEKQYEDICKTLVHNYTVAKQQLAAFMDLKNSSPKLYYSVTIVTLMLLAYIGNNINNLVLTYIFVTVMLLVPGLVRHGILHNYYQLVLQSIANLLKSLHGGGGSSDKVKVN